MILFPFILKEVRIKPTVQTSAYSSAQVIGGLQTLSNAFQNNGGTSKLTKITIVDADKQSAHIKVLFFSQPLPNTTPASKYADAAAFDPAFKDMTDNFLGEVDIPAASYVALANVSEVTVNLNEGLDLKSWNKNLYVIVLSQGTPHYTAATSLGLAFEFEQF